MGLPRSTFYDAPEVDISDEAMVDVIATICDDFESYGYRRVAAVLRHQGLVVNGKKIRRLMRTRPAAEAALAIRHHNGQRS